MRLRWDVLRLLPYCVPEASAASWAHDQAMGELTKPAPDPRVSIAKPITSKRVVGRRVALRAARETISNAATGRCAAGGLFSKQSTSERKPIDRLRAKNSRGDAGLEHAPGWRQQACAKAGARTTQQSNPQPVHRAISATAFNTERQQTARMIKFCQAATCTGSSTPLRGIAVADRDPLAKHQAREY